MLFPSRTTATHTLVETKINNAHAADNVVDTNVSYSTRDQPANDQRTVAVDSSSSWEIIPGRNVVTCLVADKNNDTRKQTENDGSAMIAIDSNRSREDISDCSVLAYIVKTESNNTHVADNDIDTPTSDTRKQPANNCPAIAIDPSRNHNIISSCTAAVYPVAMETRINNTRDADNVIDTDATGDTSKQPANDQRTIAVDSSRNCNIIPGCTAAAYPVATDIKINNIDTADNQTTIHTDSRKSCESISDHIVAACVTADETKINTLHTATDTLVFLDIREQSTNDKTTITADSRKICESTVTVETKINTHHIADTAIDTDDYCDTRKQPANDQTIVAAEYRKGCESNSGCTVAASTVAGETKINIHHAADTAIDTDGTCDIRKQLANVRTNIAADYRKSCESVYGRSISDDTVAVETKTNNIANTAVDTDAAYDTSKQPANDQSIPAVNSKVHQTRSRKQDTRTASDDIHVNTVDGVTITTVGTDKVHQTRSRKQDINSSNINGAKSKSCSFISETNCEEKIPPGAKPKIRKTTDNKTKNKDKTNRNQPKRGRKNTKRSSTGSSTTESKTESKTNEGLDHCIICDNYCSENSIECTNCNQWLHYDCLKIDAKLVADYELNPDCPFICPSCVHLNNSDMTRIAASQIVIQSKDNVSEPETHLNVPTYSTESPHASSTENVVSTSHMDVSERSAKHALPTTTRNSSYNEEEVRLKQWEKKLTQLEKETQKKIKDLTDKSKQLAHTQSYMTKLETKITKLEENERLYKIQLAAQSSQQQHNAAFSTASQSAKDSQPTLPITNHCSSTHSPGNQPCHMTRSSCPQVHADCSADNERMRISTRLNALELDIIKQRIAGIESQKKDIDSHKPSIYFHGQPSLQPNHLPNPLLNTIQPVNGFHRNSVLQTPQPLQQNNGHSVSGHPINEHLEMGYSIIDHPTPMNGQIIHGQYPRSMLSTSVYPVSEHYLRGHPINEHPMTRQPVYGHPVSEHHLRGHPINEHSMTRQLAYRHPVSEHHLRGHPINEHSMTRQPAYGHPVSEHHLRGHPINEHSMTRQTAYGHPVSEHHLRGHPINEHSMTRQPANGHPVSEHHLRGHPINEHPMTRQPANGHPVSEHHLRGHPINEHSMTRQPANGHPVSEHQLRGHPINEHSLTRQPAYGHPMNRHNMSEQQIHRHPMSGHRVNVHQAYNNTLSTSGHQVHGHPTSKFLTTGHLVNGHLVGEQRTHGYPGVRRYPVSVPQTYNNVHSTSGHLMNEHNTYGHHTNRHVVNGPPGHMSKPKFTQQFFHQHQPYTNGSSHFTSAATTPHPTQNISGQFCPPLFSSTAMCNAQSAGESLHSHRRPTRNIKRRESNRNINTCADNSLSQRSGNAEESTEEVRYTTVKKTGHPRTKGHPNFSDTSKCTKETSSVKQLTRPETKNQDNNTTISNSTAPPMKIHPCTESEQNKNPKIIDADNTSVGMPRSLPSSDTNSTNNMQSFLEHGRASTLWDIHQFSHLNQNYLR